MLAFMRARPLLRPFAAQVPEGHSLDNRVSLFMGFAVTTTLWGPNQWYHHESVLTVFLVELLQSYYQLGRLDVVAKLAELLPAAPELSFD